MLYKGKDYSDNEILEILNNKDNDILTYKEKLDGAEAKIKTFENGFSSLTKQSKETITPSGFSLIFNSLTADCLKNHFGFRLFLFCCLFIQ